MSLSHRTQIKPLKQFRMRKKSKKITLDKLEKNEDFLRKPVDEKWTIIFKNPDFIALKKLASVMLSVFSSNAFCDSIFSIVKNVKSDNRNQMKIK